MNSEEIQDKFNMSMAQRLTMDLDKCEVNHVLQGLALFKTKEGQLTTVPFTLESEKQLPFIVANVHRSSAGMSEFVGISFAQKYMHYTFQSKEKEQAETSSDSLGSDSSSPLV